MEQLIGILFFAGIIAAGFYVAKKNKSDVTRTPKSGGSGVKPVDGKGGDKV
jgi:hypothetical protein